jgi:hypothetical protein
MTSVCDRIRQTNHATMVRRENFVEEQAVRKMLGPDLWKQLCDEFVREVQSVNEVQAGKILVKRTRLSLAVADSDSARKLELKYIDFGPGISITLENECNTITFRVNASPVPSLTLMLDEQPVQPRDLVENVMVRLTR